MKKELGLYRAIRRYLFIIFNKEYIKEALKRRKGRCKKCGCCEARLVACIHFDNKSKLCRLWKEKGFEALPYVCKIGPFDEKDKSNFCKEHCGYYWEEEDERKS